MQQGGAVPVHSLSVETGDAPPKQVAQALERLGEAGRLIADVRLGADRMLEALFLVAAEPHNQRASNMMIQQDALIRQNLQSLRHVGKQLEESGVLNDSLLARINSWGLHMPLVCPDGAVVAYAWKRQLAGHAGASAVDRTRLAFKAFADQKKQFFPHLVDDECNTESAAKRHCGPMGMNSVEELGDMISVADILSHLVKVVPDLQTFAYERLDWSKRASSLPSTTNGNSTESLNDHGFTSSCKMRQGSGGIHTVDKPAVIELLLPCVFRAVVSLHTAGSMDPDSVAFFSPDEGGRYMHAHGFSLHHVFKHVSEHANMALQYFICANPETALHSLLHWICTYHTLFSKTCSKCKKLLLMDRQSAVILPPVKRSFRNYVTENRSFDLTPTFHTSCFSG